MIIFLVKLGHNTSFYCLKSKAFHELNAMLIIKTVDGMVQAMDQATCWVQVNQ